MTDLQLEIRSYGCDTGRGNLLGIQPAMSTADYASEEGFCARLGGYLEAARQQGWLNGRTIAVWPEHIGTWLVGADAGPREIEAPTFRAALAPLVRRHLIPFLRAFFSAREKDRVAAALFRARAGAMARAYQSAFSALARRYGVTVVGGSTVLPSPRVVGGQVVPGGGPLYNASAVFTPDGRAMSPVVHKAFPTEQELPFTAAAPVGELPAFDTPAGRLGVLICADSWYPQAYARLREHGVEWLAVPSSGITRESWDEPWPGYNGAPPPPDVDLRDVEDLTEGEAWSKYALAGRMALSGARCGVNVFSRGVLWDMGEMGGQAALVAGSTVFSGARAGAEILNLWLE